MENIFCVIMAGGIGSRFWPMSRTSYPKQFLDMLGTGKTMIRQTYERFDSICKKENVLVVTNEIYKYLVLEQLPELEDHQVLCEPARRNTAPCIAYANQRIKALNSDAQIIVAPADHLVLQADIFSATITTALEQADLKNCLVTLGIKPSRPDTGYGYIQFDHAYVGVAEQVKKVNLFTEKPNPETAKEFIESGDYYWNSGIFIWNLSSINDAFEKHLPEINSLFMEGEAIYGTADEDAFIKKTYEACTSISIDYGVMEKADNVFVVLSDFGWSDLGTWGSLYDHLAKDKHQNASIGKQVVYYDSENCVVSAPDDKLVVLQGLKDYIVIETKDVLLVCRKEDEQQIKQFAQDAETSSGVKYL